MNPMKYEFLPLSKRNQEIQPTTKYQSDNNLFIFLKLDWKSLQVLQSCIIKFTKEVLCSYNKVNKWDHKVELLFNPRRIAV